MSLLNLKTTKHILFPIPLISIVIFLIYKDILIGSAILNSDFFNYFNNFIILKKQIEIDGFYTFSWYWKEYLGYPANYQLNSNYSVLHNFYLLFCILFNLDLKEIFYGYQLLVISTLGLTSYFFCLFLNKSIFKINFYLSIVCSLFLLTAFTMLSFLNAAGLIFSLFWIIIFFFLCERFYETKRLKYIYLIIFSFFQVIYCLAFEYLYFAFPLFLYLLIIDKRYLLVFSFFKELQVNQFFYLFFFSFLHFLPLLTFIDFLGSSTRNLSDDSSNNFDIYWNFIKINSTYYFFYGYHLIICLFTSILLIKDFSHKSKYILLLSTIYLFLLLGNKTIFYNLLEIIPFFSNARSLYKVSPFILISLILLYANFFQEIKTKHLNYKKILFIFMIINLIHFISPGKDIFYQGWRGFTILNLFIILFFLSLKYKLFHLVTFLLLIFSIISTDKNNFAFKYNLNKLSFLESNKIDIFLEEEYLKNDFRVIYSTPLIQNYITSIKNYENLGGYQALSYQYPNMISKDTESSPENYNVKYLISTDSELKEKYPKLDISLKRIFLEKSEKILFNYSKDLIKIYVYETNKFKSKYKIIHTNNLIKTKSYECLQESISTNDKILCVEEKDIKIIKNYFINKDYKENIYIKTIKNDYLNIDLDEKVLILSSINFHKNLKLKNKTNNINIYNINNKLAFFLEKGENAVSIKFEPIFFGFNFKMIFNIIILMFNLLFCWFIMNILKIILSKTD